MMGIPLIPQINFALLAYGFSALIIYSILNTRKSLGETFGMKSSHLLILVTWLFSLTLSLICIGFLGMGLKWLISQYGIPSLLNMSYQDKKINFQVSTIQPQGEILGISSMWSRANTGIRELILFLFLLIFSSNILIKTYF